MGGKVLVTGASGFLASWIVREFLSHGYTVIGTVRSQSKADTIRKDLAKYGDSLQFSIVPDMTAPGAFDEAVKGVDGVIHTASPVFFGGVEDNVRDMVQPAIKGTTSVMESVKKYNPGVKRLVLTSSYAAVRTPGGFPKNGDTYTEEDWNSMTLEHAAKGNTLVGYVVSKALAEKAAWEFMDKEKPNFQLAAICPVEILGPVVQPLDSWSSLNATSNDIRKLIDGSLKEIPTTIIPFWADVRDTATAHRLAYENESAAGQRYLISGGKYTFAEMCDVLRTKFPEIANRIPPKSNEPLTELDVDASKITKIGLQYRSFEDCVVDAAKSLIELEKKIGV